MRASNPGPLCGCAAERPAFESSWWKDDGSSDATTALLRPHVASGLEALGASGGVSFIKSRWNDAIARVKKSDLETVLRNSGVTHGCFVKVFHEEKTAPQLWTIELGDCDREGAAPAQEAWHCLLNEQARRAGAIARGLLCHETIEPCTVCPAGRYAGQMLWKLAIGDPQTQVPWRLNQLRILAWNNESADRPCRSKP